MAPTPDAYWLALRRIHGAGPRTCRLLLERFGSAEQVFKATEAEIAAAGVPRQLAHLIVKFSDFAPLEKELCELPRLGARLVRWTDAEYPLNLRQIADPPPYLFVRGMLASHDRSGMPTPTDRSDMLAADHRSGISLAENRCFIAVVGARAASDAGLRMAERLGLELAAHGFVVVSGLARGIDGAAHRGALQASGRTVAVLGCGIDVAYPPEHRQLGETIVEQGGAILSELPLGAAPIPENFPSRNRILSGLSLGVVIVEAAEKSGSLITARLALEQDRQVFAVPGSPLSGKTRGSNRLIKEGAVLVECVEDVIEDLAPQLCAMASPRTDGVTSRIPAASAGTSLASFEPRSRGSSVERCAEALENHQGGADREEVEQIKAILNCLTDAEKLHVDAVIESCRLSPQTVLKLLLELELKGMVVQHPGKIFSLP